MRLPIYLDNNATTRVDPRVLERMLPYFSDAYGNAASRTHAFGWAAEEAVEEARREVATLIGARTRDLVFTSGATEADNLAILGAAELAESQNLRTRHIITDQIEHPAVLDPCQYLGKRGFRVTWLRPDATGQIPAQAVADALDDETMLVSVMYANNEIGTVNPIAEIAALTRDRGVMFHCDAAQVVGKLPVDVETLGVDLLSISAHKLYGPKGVGALYVRPRPANRRIRPIVHGGGHEQGLRSGTLPVPLVVGLGAACALSGEQLGDDRARTTALATRLRDGLRERLDGVTLNGHPDQRLPGNVHLSFAGLEAQALLMSLPEVALSTGAACSSAEVKPSHVLRAIGLGADLSLASVRFGIGRFNQAEEIEYVIDRVSDRVERLRRIC